MLDSMRQCTHDSLLSCNYKGKAWFIFWCRQEQFGNRQKWGVKITDWWELTKDRKKPQNCPLSKKFECKRKRSSLPLPFSIKKMLPLSEKYKLIPKSSCLSAEVGICAGGCNKFITAQVPSINQDLQLDYITHKAVCQRFQGEHLSPHPEWWPCQEHSGIK